MSRGVSPAVSFFMSGVSAFLCRPRTVSGSTATWLWHVRIRIGLDLSTELSTKFLTAATHAVQREPIRNLQYPRVTRLNFRGRHQRRARAASPAVISRPDTRRLHVAR